MNTVKYKTNFIALNLKLMIDEAQVFPILQATYLRGFKATVLLAVGRE